MSLRYVFLYPILCTASTHILDQEEEDPFDAVAEYVFQVMLPRRD